MYICSLSPAWERVWVRGYIIILSFRGVAEKSIFVMLNYGSERVQEPDAIGRMQQCHYSYVIPWRNQNIQHLGFMFFVIHETITDNGEEINK